MKDEISLLDSRILSYIFDKDEPEKRKTFADPASDCWKRKREFAISVQNLSEFYVGVTKKISNPIPAGVASDFIEHIIDFQGWHVINYEAQTIRSAFAINVKHGIHYWDALLAATMKENNVFSIYTENDGDFDKIPWIKTLNPFENIV